MNENNEQSLGVIWKNKNFLQFNIYRSETALSLESFVTFYSDIFLRFLSIQIISLLLSSRYEAKVTINEIYASWKEFVED